MKKILISLITIVVMLFSVSVFATDSKKNKEEKGGMCPITQVKGDVDDCLKCHIIGNFSIKEVSPFRSWNLPGHKGRMIIVDGKPVAFYEIHDQIGSFIGTDLEEFLSYLNYHPEVKKVIIDIHSGGGSLFVGYQAVGVLKSWYDRFEIETRVQGFAASAAFFIFCGGETRLVSPQAELMWHELITFSMFDVSGPSDKEDQAKVLRHLQDTANLMLAEISKLTKDELDKKIRKKEYWLRGSEAVKVGFATGYIK